MKLVEYFYKIELFLGQDISSFTTVNIIFYHLEYNTNFDWYDKLVKRLVPHIDNVAGLLELGAKEWENKEEIIILYGSIMWN